MTLDLYGFGPALLAGTLMTIQLALCALALSFDPGCKTYHFIDSLPYGRDRYGEHDVIATMAHLGYFSRRIRIDANSAMTPSSLFGIARRIA